MKKSIFITVLVICQWTSLIGQESNIYNLLTEPSLTRPLTQHKGFLQIYGGYSHLNGNNYFDNTGSKLPFTEAVRSMIEHRYQFDISYGILEHLELYTGISYNSRYETLPSYLIDNRPGIGYEDRTYHQHGLSNLDLILKYRLPDFLSGFDMYIFGGIQAPISSQYPQQPGHSIILEDKNNPASSYQLQYEFNPPSGSPALFYSAGFNLLYATKKMGVSLKMNIQNPFSDVETFTWVTRRYGDEFEYLKLWYFTRPKGLISGGAHYKVQVYPWFAVNAGYDYYTETLGWSEVSGQTVALTSSSAGFISAGIEIQVSTHLRILQQVNFPVNGNSTYSEFCVSAGFTYSLVPLKNKFY